MGDEKAMKKGKEDREGKRKMTRGDAMLLAAYQNLQLPAESPTSTHQRLQTASVPTKPPHHPSSHQHPPSQHPLYSKPPTRLWVLREQGGLQLRLGGIHAAQPGGVPQRFILEQGLERKEKERKKKKQEKSER